MVTGPVEAPALSAELASGERVLWQGRPDTRGWFTAQDVFLIPFSLMWGGFAIFWEASALSSSSARSSVIFPLWGIPFVLIGLYLIFGRFFARRWVRNATFYAVTDRRVIEISRSILGARRVNSIWLASYPPVDRRIRGDGRGTLWIGTFPLGRTFAVDPSWPGAGRMTANGVMLADIDDAAPVAALITDQLGGRPRRGFG